MRFGRDSPAPGDLPASGLADEPWGDCPVGFRQRLISGGILDRRTIRGFESNGRIVDNFLTGFQGRFPPDDIERVEIVKGPSAILSPSGSPGGSVNTITSRRDFPGTPRFS